MKCNNYESPIIILIQARLNKNIFFELFPHSFKQ